MCLLICFVWGVKTAEMLHRAEFGQNAISHIRSNMDKDIGQRRISDALANGRHVFSFPPYPNVS